MNFQCEVTNSNVKTKKEKDYKYKVTVVTLEAYRVNDEIVGLVNQEVSVDLHGVSFHATVISVTAKIKKVNKIPVRYFVIKLEFEGTNDGISLLVNKSVDAELNE